MLSVNSSVTKYIGTIRLICRPALLSVEVCASHYLGLLLDSEGGYF